MIRRALFISLGLIVALAGAAALFHFLPALRAARFSGLGEKAWAAGDISSAAHWHTRALRAMPGRAASADRLVGAVRKSGDAAALERWWREGLFASSPRALRTGAKEALALGRPALADAMLSDAGVGVGPETVFFHNLRSAIALALNDLATAETHTRLALAEEPGDADHKSNLLAILLREGDPDRAREVESLINELHGVPSHAERMKRMLRDYALSTRGAKDALAISRTMRGWDAKDFGIHAALLLRAEPASVEGWLRSAVARCRETPGAPGAVALALLGAGADALASGWLEHFGAEKGGDPRLLALRVEALCRAGAWDEARSALEAGAWEGAEHLRKAYEARLLASSGDAIGAEVRWGEAIREALRPHARQIELLDRTVGWKGWEERRIKLLQAVLEDKIHADRAYAELYALYRARGRTEDLLGLSFAMLRAVPGHEAAANNRAALQLLLGREPEAAHRFAEEQAARFPGKPIPASTRALSFFLRGDPQAALATLEGLDPRALAVPEIAHYHAVYLAACGRVEDAAKAREIASRASLLVEEKQLAERFLPAGQ